MNVNTGRQIVLAARPSSKPQLSDFRLEEVGVPTPRSGQVLLGVLYLSLDPYMRGRMDDRKSYAKPLQVGDVMVGEAVARVIESRHPEYSERDIVLAQTGWRTHAVADGAGVRKIDQAGLPVTTRLGVLGMPGFTAYSGLRKVAAGIVDGRIRYREDIVDHLENAPEAFIGMLDGRNFGKVIVRVAAEGGIYEQA